MVSRRVSPPQAHLSQVGEQARENQVNRETRRTVARHERLPLRSRPQGCRKVAQHVIEQLLFEPRFSADSADGPFGQFASTPVPIWPIAAQHCPSVGQPWGNVSQPLAKCWPTFVNVGQHLANVGQFRANPGRCWASLAQYGQVWPKSAKFSADMFDTTHRSREDPL